MITPTQKQTAQAIVNIFETGSPRGDYGKVTLRPNDPGHLTYGRSQTTLASGGLATLIHAYCRANGELAGRFKDYLPALDQRDQHLDSDEALKTLLRDAGKDPAMQRVQDEFFEQSYWEPSLENAGSLGIESPLGVTVVYDSWVHGSFKKMQERTSQRFGSVPLIGEARWIMNYIAVRREWLATHDNPRLRETVYRMDTFHDLVARGAWELPLPLTVRGFTIMPETLPRI